MGEFFAKYHILLIKNQIILKAKLVKVHSEDLGEVCVLAYIILI